MVMIASTKTNFKKSGHFCIKSFGGLQPISRDTGNIVMKQKELMINLYMFSSTNMAAMTQREITFVYES